MQDSKGINSLKQAREILERNAPKGEHLAYINNEEADYLKNRGGSGIMTVSGIRSYGFLKKITKPFAKILDKIVPNEIKPALPFIAAALPFLAPGLLAGIGSLGGLITNTTLQGAIGSGLVNLASQSSQEGAAKYGINPLSLGLSALGGALAAPGSAGEFATMKSFTPGELQYASSIPTGSLEGGLFPQSSNLYIDAGLTNPNLATTNTLQNLQNIGSTLAEKGATAFDTARSALEPEGAGIFSKEFLTAAVPGQIGAAGDLAYFQAAKALDEFDKQQSTLGAMGVANTEARRAAVKRAMGLSGFNESEISSAITRLGLATGGRVGYQMGGGTKPQPMPINPDMLAMAIFGKSYDELTYTQKSAIADMLPNKKAEGGIMDLGGKEMDLRAKGGFVPIGEREKADDVPARLSKNEFVFTANAVRGAGKGNIKKGAKRMYNLMKQYEAMA
jgi:hypothetical protein